MEKVILNIKKKFSKKKRQKGISMVSLVITIIIMLILTAVAYGYSMKTVDEADYSKYVSDFSDVATAFEEKSMTVKGEKAADSNQKNIEQVYNYVAKAGKDDEEFLVISELPAYTIIKDEAQLGIELPKMTVESGTGKRVQAKFATTKNGEVFLWPPYEYEQKLYITPNNVVEHKLQTTITVGKETFEIVLDPVDGSLVDIKQDNNLPPVDEPSGDKEEHLVHEFNSKTETSKYLHSAATCTSPAVYYYKCSQCDEKGTNTYTSGVALNHNYGSYQVTKAANCGETGERKRSCSRCGDVQTQAIEKDTSKHIGGEISETTKTASCTKTGTKVYKCSTCKATLRTETIPALEHSYGEYVVTKVATCAEAGVKTKTCARCNDEQTQEIAKNSSNHTGGQVSEITKQATCTEEGTKAIKCSGCNVTLSTETIATTGHSYGSYTTVKAATCLTGGTEERKCKNCNDIQTRNVAALGHIDTNPADNSCDRCGIVIKEVPGLGDVEVSDPDLEVEYDPGTGDASGVVPPADDEPEPPAEIPEEELPEIIEFGFGNFESNTTYTPGTYETVPYETTYTRNKYPVTYQGVVWSKWNVTKDSDGNITKVVPKEIELADIDKKYSTYILYDFETDEYLEMEGVRGDSVELWTIYNTEDDSKENIVYLAAYLNKLENNPNRHAAMWDGTKYVAVDYDAEIDAIDTFTTTYTVTGTKQVQVTAPTTSTEYVYVPAGTLKAEEGMTWAKWLESDYNTTGETNPTIKTSDFEDVSNDSVIVAGKDYGFMFYDINGIWTFNDTLDFSTIDGFIEQNVKYNCEAYSTERTMMGISTINGGVIVYASSGGELYTNGQWIGEAYKTVDFGNISQPVSKEFYEWFTANAKQYTLSGEWKLNDSLSLDKEISENILFTSCNNEFNAMNIFAVNDSIFTITYTLVHPDEDYAEINPYASHIGWGYPIYKDIDFGTEPQPVSKEFYDWFTANAKQYTLSGKWSFDEVPNVTDVNILQNIKFYGPESDTYYSQICVGNKYNLEYSSDAGENTYIGYKLDNDKYPLMDDNIWTAYYEINVDNGTTYYDWLYRDIDFGTEPQPVSKEFYDWFTANATKGKLITFKVNGKEYNAIEGMTWGEFIESEYAPTTDEKYWFEVKSEHYVGYVQKGSWSNVHINTSSERAEWTSDTIVPGNDYVLTADYGPYGGSHSGGSN